MVLKCVKILSRFLCRNNLGLRVRPMSCSNLRAFLLLLKGLVLFVDRGWADHHREKGIDTVNNHCTHLQTICVFLQVSKLEGIEK